MSDFVQTMKDWRRMCKAQDDTTCGACSSCPMGDDGKSCMAVYEDEFETVDFAHIEQTVTEWAAEHPVVYPTWGEWLIKIGGAVKKLYAQQYHYEAAQPTQLIEVVEVLDEPIPADIAEKLGIEPKC